MSALSGSSRAARPDPRLTGYFYALTITAHDAIFDSAVGSYALLTMPDGTVRRVPLGPRHVATVSNLPQGNYQVQVKARGASVSGADVPLVQGPDGEPGRGDPRRHRRRRRRAAGRVGRDPVAVTDPAPAYLRLPAASCSLSAPRGDGGGWMMAGSRARWIGVLALCGVLAACCLGLGIGASAPRAAPAPRQAPAASPATPLFAYYYNWFNASSWDRESRSTIRPPGGRYSSDDPRVIPHPQIQQAKSAGIDGFIVSWKEHDHEQPRAPAAADDNRGRGAVQGRDDLPGPGLRPEPPAGRRGSPRISSAVPRLLRRRPRSSAASRRKAADDLQRDVGHSTTTAWRRSPAPVRSSLQVLSTEKSLGGYRRLPLTE